MTNQTDTDTFWQAANAAGWRLRMRTLEMGDRLGDGATPEQIADEVMAESDADEIRLACYSYALSLAHLELRERGMPPGHELTRAGDDREHPAHDASRARGKVRHLLIQPRPPPLRQARRRAASPAARGK